MQEVAAIFYDIMKRQIYEADVCLRVRCHELSAKVIDGRVLVVVLSLGKRRSIEKRPPIVRVKIWAAVFLPQARLVKADKELWVGSFNLWQEEGLQIVDTLPASIIATPLSAMSPCCSRRVGTGKEPRSPGGLALHMIELAFLIDDRPSDRS